MGWSSARASRGRATACPGRSGQLRARGVDTLVLAGISTSGVTISTLIEAHDRDYRLFVLADATVGPDAELHASLIEGFFPKRAEVIEVADLGCRLA